MFFLLYLLLLTLPPISIQILPSLKILLQSYLFQEE